MEGVKFKQCLHIARASHLQNNGGYYYKQRSGEQGKAMRQYRNLTYSRSVWRHVRHIKCPQWVCIGTHKSKLQMVQMNFRSIFLRSSSLILVPGMIGKMFQLEKENMSIQDKTASFRSGNCVTAWKQKMTEMTLSFGINE